MNRFQVIIIGAGPSGIAAAARLLERGFTNFTVLEAQNRIGGRIFTKKFGDNICEVGAQWVHGQKGNIVHDMAAKHELIYESDEPFSPSSFFDSSGKPIDKELSVKMMKLYWHIMEESEEALKNNSHSLGEYFTSCYVGKVAALEEELKLNTELQNEFLWWLEKMENSIDASGDWFETSGKGHLEYWDCEGNLLLSWKDGYCTLLDLLTKKFPDPTQELPVRSKVQLNKEVRRVSWSSAPVQVECQDGSVWLADHVVVTVPLGVLKERAATMFHPQLPEVKLRSIQGLGFGTVDKIFLKFPARWWSQDPDGFSFLWKQQDQAPEGWLRHVLGFYPDSYQPNVLLGWITGPAAQQMEGCSDKEVLEGCMGLLQSFLKGRYPVIPKAEAIQRSTWYANPYFRGSYSFRSMDSDRLDVWASHLAQPVVDSSGRPVLLFGGEASHEHYFSTVHGAVESGRREADRLLDYVLDYLKYQVVIVGAGISGLAAARTLLKSGVVNILLVEALPVAGGRVRSIPLGDTDFLELGAQWIHGEKNEVFDICARADLLCEPCEPRYREAEGLYLREDGSLVEQDVVRWVDDAVKDILEECEGLVHEAHSEPCSIGHILSTRFEELLGRCQDTDEVKLVKKDLLSWHIKFQVIDNACANLDDLSANAWGLYRFCGGNDYNSFKLGYGSLVDALLESIPREKRRLATPVRRVDWSHDENVVRVTCEDVELAAEHVIVTCSLGYLKAHHKTLFQPRLPGPLSEAVETLGFGLIEKIFLVYETRWWEDGVKGFQLVWSAHHDVGGAEEDWCRHLTGFDVLPTERPVLIGWIGGDGAALMQRVSEDDVAEATTRVLRKFTGDQLVPRPRAVWRSQWHTNEFTLGGYSHVTLQSHRSGITGSCLAQPVYTTVCKDGIQRKKPTVLLAGEATHDSHYSTVHGAYESGVHQAEVLALYIQQAQL